MKPQPATTCLRLAGFQEPPKRGCGAGCGSLPSLKSSPGHCGLSAVVEGFWSLWVRAGVPELRVPQAMQYYLCEAGIQGITKVVHMHALFSDHCCHRLSLWERVQHRKDGPSSRLHVRQASHRDNGCCPSSPHLKATRLNFSRYLSSTS